MTGSPFVPSSSHAACGGSSGKLGGALGGEGAGRFSRPFDMHRYRTVFPGRWAGFLKAHFPDVITVAWAFSVDEKTARHWWNGTNAPSGAIAVAACAEIPGAIEYLWGKAA